VVVDIPDVITYANFGEDRLRDLGVAGLKFALLHWLWSSPLQHSRTTMRVCDNCTNWLWCHRAESTVS